MALHDYPAESPVHTSPWLVDAQGEVTPPADPIICFEATDENGPFIPAFNVAPVVALNPTTEGVDDSPVTSDELDKGFWSRRLANIRELGHAAKADVQESKSKKRTLGLGALAVGTQIFDRARIIVLLAPPAAIGTMEQTNNPWLAGLAAAGVYAGFNYANGEALTQGLAAYPKTMNTFNTKYPGVVSAFEKSLPGLLETTKEQAQSPEERITNRKLGSGVISSMIKNIKESPGKLGKHARRSMAGISLGSTAFVSTASARGRSKKDVRKINAGVTADGAAGVFAIGTGLTWSIRELAMRGQLETADKINSVVDNKWTWYGVAALSIISEYAVNHKQNRKLLREQTPAVTTLTT